MADVQYPLCVQGCVLSWRGYAIWNQATGTLTTDNTRQGVNPYETILNAGTIATSTCKAQTSFTTDGQIYAQPLYMSGLPSDYIRSGTGDALFVATEHGSLYSLEGKYLTLISQHSVMAAGDTAVPSAQLPGSCSNITSEVGITSTPVIDPAPPSSTGNPILFAVAKSVTTATSNYRFMIHAWDFVGNSATDISQDVGSLLGWSSAQALVENQRASLALSHDSSGNAIIYVAFGSHCDTGTASASFMGTMVALKYTYSTSKFSLLGTFTPELSTGKAGGIWMAGAAPAVDDASGNVYVVTGNGNYVANSSFGQSVVQLSQSLTPVGSYTPNKWAIFNNGSSNNATPPNLCANLVTIPSPNSASACLMNDQDFGSGGPVLAHPTNQTINSLGFEVMAAGKLGIEYLLDPTKMGQGLTSGADSADPCGTQSLQCFSAMTLSAPGTTGVIPDGSGARSAPVFWGGDAGKNIYANFLFTGGSDDTNLRIWNAPSSGTFSTIVWATGLPPLHGSLNSFPYSGAGTLLTWDDSTLSSAIIWTLDTSGYGSGAVLSPAILSAYRANQVQGTLNKSAIFQDSSSGPWANKFTVPVVVNGQAFVAGQSPSNKGACSSGSSCSGMVVRWGQ